MSEIGIIGSHAIYGDFDAQQSLGPRGHKYATEPTKYLLAATLHLLDCVQFSASIWAPERCGVVIGTNWAAEGTLAEFDRVILSQGARHLMPMEAPNFSVNIPASQISIRYAFKAFNLTVTTPVVAGLQAIALARSAMYRNRGDFAIVGATDGLPSSAMQLVTEGCEPGACVLALARGTDGVRIIGSGSVYSAQPASDMLAAAGLAKQLGAPSGRPLAWQHVAFHCERSHALQNALERELVSEGFTVVPTEVIRGPERYLTGGPLLVLWQFRDFSDALVTASSPRGHLVGVRLHGP
jgi:3-oxoacyl-[acyl-carrier-protein] synthase II